MEKSENYLEPLHSGLFYSFPIHGKMKEMCVFLWDRGRSRSFSPVAPYGDKPVAESVAIFLGRSC